MIKPNEIKEKRLSTAVNGYDIDETNAYLAEIAESYAAVCEENKELYRKMEILANKIVEYRAEEDTIKEALIAAQRTAGEITKSAKEKAEKLISDARDYVANLTKEKTDIANAIAAEAQEKADGILNSAKSTAQDMMDKAKAATDDLITKAKEEKERHESLASILKSESAAFKASLVSLYEQELNRLKELKADVADILTPAEKQEEIEEEPAQEEPAQEEPAQEEPAEAAEEASKETDKFEEVLKDLEEELGELEEGLEEAEEIAEAEEIEEIAEDEEIEEVEEIEEIEEITDNSTSGSMIDVDIAAAINAFTADKITPVEGYPVAEITEEPEMEPTKEEDDELPFESFFNVKTPEARTNEKLSLVPPEDFEPEDDDDDLKFRGFFKKKKK